MTKPSMMQRSWGPVLEKDGGVTFRLWAPAEETITHLVEGRETTMQRMDDGWRSLTTDAKGDVPYAFRLRDGTMLPDPAAHAQVNDVHGLSPGGALHLRANLIDENGAPPPLPGEAIYSFSPRGKTGPWISAAFDRTQRISEPKVPSTVPTEMIFERSPCISATS